MTCLAVLVGNSVYRTLARLDCCVADIDAMATLLEATQKYEKVLKLENLDADRLKSSLRQNLDQPADVEELFFYFTGHGFQGESGFYLCATNFDVRRPNETGISATELHTFLKLTGADLVVKVMDACNSGTQLIKAGEGWLQNKEGFRNIIQIASCLDTQNSLTGDPISLFTEKFRSASLRKPEGAVYYTDIIDTLRDEFLSNDLQTPFFVSQHTGREQFVDDARKLNGLRATLERIQNDLSLESSAPLPVARPASLLQRLEAADKKMVQPNRLSMFVDEFLDRVVAKVSTSEFSEFFDLEIVEHAQFDERTPHNFMVRVLSREKRPDNFVTASYSKTKRELNPIYGAAYEMMQRYLDEDAYNESWDLSLNCVMRRAQLRLTFTPKFMSLQRIVLVVSCAPSLEICYVFEVSTTHLLRDFAKFDEDGSEVSRRWWKLRWDESTKGIEEQITEKLFEIVRTQLESAEKRLSPPGS